MLEAHKAIIEIVLPKYARMPQEQSRNVLLSQAVRIVDETYTPTVHPIKKILLIIKELYST